MQAPVGPARRGSSASEVSTSTPASACSSGRTSTCQRSGPEVGDPEADRHELVCECDESVSARASRARAKRAGHVTSTAHCALRHPCKVTVVARPIEPVTFQPGEPSTTARQPTHSFEPPWNRWGVSAGVSRASVWSNSTMSTGRRARGGNLPTSTTARGRHVARVGTWSTGGQSTPAGSSPPRPLIYFPKR